jgi:hypothetical protein
MSQFREIRKAIRNLGPLQYWGIQKGCSVVDDVPQRRFFIMQGPKPYRTVQEKWYRVSNWRKRLAFLESLRSAFLAQKEKHWPTTNKTFR